MEQNKINRYVENLDNEALKDLLKRTLEILLKSDLSNAEIDEIIFIGEQINEFNEHFNEQK